MFERYKSKIERYCDDYGIEIPVGFQRHDAGRYVAIDLDASPPKLVATTWATEADAVKYLASAAAGSRLRLLDFEDRRELDFNERSRLVKGASF